MSAPSHLRGWGDTEASLEQGTTAATWPKLPARCARKLQRGVLATRWVGARLRLFRPPPPHRPCVMLSSGSVPHLSLPH